MKITIQKEKLLNAIKAVRGIVQGRPAQLILSAALIETIEDKKIRLTTTDLNHTMSFTLDAEIIKEGKIAIDIRFLEEIIMKLQDGKNVTLETNDEEKGKVKIQSDKTKYEVVTMNPDEFPDILNSKNIVDNEFETKTFTIEIKELNKAIKQTSFAAVQTGFGGILCGVSFIIEDNLLEMVGTDGNRLARSIIPINSKGEKVSFVVPYKTIVEISRILSLSSDKETQFTIKGPKITFEFSEIVFQSNLMEGQFPKYQQLIPVGNPRVAYLDREKFIDTIGRISVMASNKTNIMKFDFKPDNTLEISADTTESGSAKENAEVEYSKEDILIAFNYKYMLDCLRNMTSERIVIEMSTNLAAAVFKPFSEENSEKQDNYLCLIMPVQVR